MDQKVYCRKIHSQYIYHSYADINYTSNCNSTQQQVIKCCDQRVTIPLSYLGDTGLKCWPRDKLFWVNYFLTFLSAPNMYFKQKPAVIQLPKFQEIRKFLSIVHFHKDIHIKYKSIPVSESGTSYTGTTLAFP